MATVSFASTFANSAPPAFFAALRAARSQLAQPFVAYNKACMKNPVAVGVTTTLLKTAAADAFAQMAIERRESMDWRRNSLFSIFGLTYLGGWQYFLYAKCFPAWTPAITAAVGSRLTAPVLVAIDQGIHHPLMYFPCFYLLRGALDGRPATESLSACATDMPDNLKACWAVWVPAQLVNFSVVPSHLRVPFVAGVSFLWCIILSGLRGANKGDSGPSTCSAAAAAALLPRTEAPSAVTDTA